MKLRRKIPPHIASQVLIANSHACCVCHRTSVQLHHIDGDPGNNDASNLACLCMDHHDSATSKTGLTRKLMPDHVAKYKSDWEARCRKDIRALTRDRLSYYCTLYKNPPRIRECFTKLSAGERENAAEILIRTISEEEAGKAADRGFRVQVVPRNNDRTRSCIQSLRMGELWPSWLPRGTAHPNDPDLPLDLTPPYGMNALHTYDLYCQLIVQALCIVSTPVPFECLVSLPEPQMLDSLAGQIVSFRQRGFGRQICSPKVSDHCPVGTLELRANRRGRHFKAVMKIRNMYVFSDTSASNLRNATVCGVAILGNHSQASVEKGGIRLNMIPLLIGMGGFGQLDSRGFDHRK